MNTSYDINESTNLYNEMHNTNLTPEEFTEKIAQYMMTHKGKNYVDNSFFNSLNRNIGMLMYECKDECYTPDTYTKILMLLSDAECYSGADIGTGIYIAILRDNGYNVQKYIPEYLKDKFMSESFDILFKYTIALAVRPK